MINHSHFLTIIFQTEILRPSCGLNPGGGFYIWFLPMSLTIPTLLMRIKQWLMMDGWWMAGGMEGEKEGGMDGWFHPSFKPFPKFIPDWPVPLTSFNTKPGQVEKFLFPCLSPPLVFPAVSPFPLSVPHFPSSSSSLSPSMEQVTQSKVGCPRSLWPKCHALVIWTQTSCS